MQPFLKWAGGKAKLVPEILKLLPPGGRYLEPFAGSAVVWLNTHYDESVLSDTNADLIALFRLLQQDAQGFIDAAQDLFTPEQNTAANYYQIRDAFNTSTDPEVRAVFFLYLNKFGFNGLCRYNASGGFNVPMGRTANGGLPSFPKKELLAFGAKLASSSVQLRCCDFREVLAEAGRGDCIYLDSPYAPVSASANFVAYSAGGFGPQDQAVLAKMAFAAKQRGAVVVVSNSNTPVTRELYADAETVVPLSVQRNISCQGNNRTKAKELLMRL